MVPAWLLYAAASYAIPKVADAIGGGGGYNVSPEMKAYYDRLIRILDNPNQFGLSEDEINRMMNLNRSEGQLAVRLAGNEYDTWAARRNISGGAEGAHKIKLMQEMIRNLQRARSRADFINFEARNRARLAALGQLGAASGAFEQGNMLNYQTDLQNSELLGNALGYGVQYGLKKYFPVNSNVSSGIGQTNYDPRVLVNPRGIYE